MRSVASVIVDMLRDAGVDRVFSVSGESYLALLDELERRNAIEVVTCRHEGGAGMMALADAKLTGRLGVAMVSRGPGATNAAISLHAAQHDAAPLLLLVGQVEKAHLRRDAFQEIDYAKFFTGTAKYTAELSEPGRVADVMSRAIHAATSGTPGPVVVALPEDVLGEMVEVTAPRAHRLQPGGPGAEAMSEVLGWLGAAERPLLIVGGELANAEGRAALLAAAEAWQVPVMTSFRRHDLFPNHHALFAGELGFSNTPEQMARLQESDLVLAAGTRLGDTTTHGYSFPASPQPAQRMVHVLRDPAMLGTNYAPDLALACSARLFLEALTEAAPNTRPDRGAWARELRHLLSAVTTWVPKTAPDGVVYGNVITEVSRHLTPDAIVAMDAGISAGLMYRYHAWTPPQILLTPITGTMGWGMPAAVAAAMRHPERQVVCMIGDGGMLMGGMELAAAAQRKLPILIILANNSSYGAIRLNLDRAYPGRTTATELHNPDFIGLARAFGCRAFSIETEDQVAPVLAQAFAERNLTFVEVKTSLSIALPPRPA